RYENGRRFAIVVVAEGAQPVGGKPFFIEKQVPGRAERYGGIADQVAKQISECTGFETRSMVLGHLQRGGSPTAYDRLIATRFGAAAVRAVEQGAFGSMVALHATNIRTVAIADAISQIKNVPLDSDMIMTARALGISFGD
ncbi:MAG: 6-phosphofructokinase, partial [Gemmatimonadota bacterium]